MATWPVQPQTAWCCILHVGQPGLGPSYGDANLCIGCVQVASYAGLDIAAKVFFGWAIMAMYPVISKQQDREAQE